MSLEWEQVVVDAHDPHALAAWWRDALGWVIVDEDEDEVEIRPTEDRMPGILFGACSDDKTDEEPAPPRLPPRRP